MGSATRGFPIKRDNRGRTVPFTLRATPISKTSAFLPLLLQASFLLAAVALPPPSVLPSSPSRHGAKSTKGKGVAKDAGAAEPPESALAVQRTQSAFFPSTVDVFELRDSFRPLWGVKTGGGGIRGIQPRASSPLTAPSLPQIGTAEEEADDE